VTAQGGDSNSPFFALQASVILENGDQIEPERIESYIAAEGYQPLAATSSRSPRDNWPSRTT
jgi:bidirectional [NiFe] hydrogenase diaphorase subunit